MSVTVLVVDDEKNIRTTLADILADEGYEVTTADSGERALKLCRRRPFDIVLLDVRMRGIDGVEAFRRIRERQDGVPVIMMSAYTMDEMERVLLQEGAVAFLRKPLDVGRMLRLIKERSRG
jgi:CheY-like chemotaxis protein